MNDIIIKRYFPLKKLTTIKIGGPAKYFVIARKVEHMLQALAWAKQNKIKWFILGEGSNIVPSDLGFNGLIIKNEIRDFDISKKDSYIVNVGAGENLLKFILKLNRLGLAGMEKMAGIPGTIGGAIYGCAGAYGQEIKDCLKRVKIYDGSPASPRRGGAGGDGASICYLSDKQCQFTYRSSIFKKERGWIILEVEFKFKKAEAKDLQKVSREIMKIRNGKYPPELACPGSFFKNIVIKDIKPSPRRQFLKKIDQSKINHGKLPSGYLLEIVGAKGMKEGGIRVAPYHGNLLYNHHLGKASEVKKIATVLKRKVKRKFGINLEEEIQYL